MGRTSAETSVRTHQIGKLAQKLSKDVNGVLCPHHWSQGHGGQHVGSRKVHAAGFASQNSNGPFHSAAPKVTDGVERYCSTHCRETIILVISSLFNRQISITSSEGILGIFFDAEQMKPRHQPTTAIPGSSPYTPPSPCVSTQHPHPHTRRGHTDSRPTLKGAEAVSVWTE